MHIIPVIDLYQGQVVHARYGQRQHYQPLRSGLCTGSEPSTIVQAMLGLYCFTTLYIADLDAIQGNGNNNGIINRLRQEFPQLVFWLDAGKFRKEDFSGRHHSSLVHVIGSETGITAGMLNELTGILPEPVLSLDFKSGDFSGDTEILHQPQIWPRKIIIMNLTRVGSCQGPDMDLLHDIKSAAAGKKIYMAGGIRNTGDLRVLDDRGVTGALVATALHNGSITGQELAELK